MTNTKSFGETMVSDWIAMVLAMGAAFSEWRLASRTSSIEIQKNM